MKIRIKKENITSTQGPLLLILSRVVICIPSYHLCHLRFIGQFWTLYVVIQMDVNSGVKALKIYLWVSLFLLFDWYICVHFNCFQRECITCILHMWVDNYDLLIKYINTRAVCEHQQFAFIYTAGVPYKSRNETSVLLLDLLPELVAGIRESVL